MEDLNAWEHEEEHTFIEKQIVYALPGMEQAIVRKDISYKHIEDLDLKLDIYYPPGHDRTEVLPAIIFIHGDTNSSRIKHAKEWGQYTSWGRLCAVSGLIAVVANHRSSAGLHNVVGVANDIDDLISYVRDNAASLQIDAENLGIWTCSNSGYIGLRAALLEAPPYIRALACYYGFTELSAYYQTMYHLANDEAGIPPLFDEEDFAEFSASELLLRRPNEVAPIFIARAGMDLPELNESLDGFIDEAISQNVLLTVINHPTGQHGFDLRDDNARSREIIRATLEFFKEHLLE